MRLAFTQEKLRNYIHDYVRPQENAIIPMCDGLLLNDKHIGLFITALSELNVSIWPYSMTDLENAKHINELPSRDQVTLNIDYGQMGLGGQDSWAAFTYPEYTLNPGEYYYAFAIRPYMPAMGSFNRIADCRLPSLTMPNIHRDKQGLITISSDGNRQIRYTINGADPDLQSQLYTQPFMMPQKGTIKTVAIDSESIVSEVRTAVFDDLLKFVNRKNWKVTYADSVEPIEGDAKHSIDGDPDTYWHTLCDPDCLVVPHQIEIDMRKAAPITGFAIIQRQDSVHGRLTDYELYLSDDGKHWGQPVSKGRFLNISETQVVKFPQPIAKRYLRLISLSPNEKWRGYTSLAEIMTIPE